jgi:hypothetical protein
MAHQFGFLEADKLSVTRYLNHGLRDPSVNRRLDSGDRFERINPTSMGVIEDQHTEAPKKQEIS